MPSGFKNSAGVDFDSLFDPYVSGTIPANTGFRTQDNVDLAGRYAPISLGTKGPDVGYRLAAGPDLSTLWAAIGTASYSIAGLNGKALDASDNGGGGASIVNATVSVTLKPDGTWAVAGANSLGNVPQPAPTSGTWLPSGHVASDYQVQYSVANSGSSERVVGNSAVTYSGITTNRTASLTLPDKAGNNAITRTASGTVTILLKRTSTGAISTTTVNMTVSTTGYL